MKYADYIERKRHGSVSFPLQYYNLDKDNPQYVMQLHWHQEMEIIFVRQGCFNVHLNEEQLCMRPGDILLVNGGSLHSGVPADDQCKYECVVFDLNMLRRHPNDAVEKYLLPVIHGDVRVKNPLCRDDPALFKAVDALFSTLKASDACYELNVYGQLFLLFSLLYRKEYLVHSNHTAYKKQAQTMTQLIDWLEINYAEPITLDLLSEKTGLSHKYLCRLFKQYTAKTVVEYVHSLRIENACHALSVRKQSITRTAYDCGFNDLSYFCKVFKRYTGVTPREFLAKENHFISKP